MRRLIECSWWVYLGALYLVLVILSVIFYYLSDASPIKWSLLYHLNLGTEMSPATWISAMSLLLLALIAFELSNMNRQQHKSWLILALLFLVLSFDELGSIHERLINFFGDMAYVMMALAGGGLVLIILNSFRRNPELRKTTFLLVVGFALLASIAPQEILEHRIDWPVEFIGLRLGIEEGLELAGILFCFAALISQRNLPSNQVTNLFPDPAIAFNKGNMVWLIIGAQVIISVLVVYALEVRPVDGNPAIWIPSALFFCLAVMAIWYWFSSSHEKRIAWGLIALLSLFLSIATLYTLSLRETSILQQEGFSLQFPILALISLPLYKTIGKTLSWWCLGIIAVGTMLVFHSHILLVYVASAIYPLVMFAIFLTGTRVDDLDNSLDYGND